MTTLIDLFELMEDRDMDGGMPFPLMGIMSDGEIVRDSLSGGLYEGTGLFWDFSKDLEEQVESVQSYIRNIL